jgi:hypothetical protein
MKRILTGLAATIITVGLFSQVPLKMSYQAVIRDAGNNLVVNHAIGMQISILQGSVSGTLVYQEVQTSSTNANGLVNIEIGGGTGFDTINWNRGPYYLKTGTDPEGGTSYSITGINQLLSVPYSLHAGTAETISGGITETDPKFKVSVAFGIDASDTVNWNSKVDSAALLKIQKHLNTLYYLNH